MNKFLLLTCLAVLLAGCSGADVISRTPRSIVIAASMDPMSQQQASSQAQSHCASQGLNASQGPQSFGGNTLSLQPWYYVTYNCVP